MADANDPLPPMLNAHARIASVVIECTAVAEFSRASLCVLAS